MGVCSARYKSDQVWQPVDDDAQAHRVCLLTKSFLAGSAAVVTQSEPDLSAEGLSVSTELFGYFCSLIQTSLPSSSNLLLCFLSLTVKLLWPNLFRDQLLLLVLKPRNY